MRRCCAIIISLATASLLALVACGGSDEPGAAAPAASKKFAVGTTEELTDVPIQSMNLASNYIRQEDDSNARYRGKVIRIEGIIEQVSLTADDIAWVGMLGASEMKIQCIFSENWTGGLPELAVSQPAILSGVVEGVKEPVEKAGDVRDMFFASSVRLTLSDCAVVEQR